MTSIMWGLVRKDDTKHIHAVYPSRAMARRVSKTYHAPNGMLVRKLFIVDLGVK